MWLVGELAAVFEEVMFGLEVYYQKDSLGSERLLLLF